MGVDLPLISDATTMPIFIDILLVLFWDRKSSLLNVSVSYAMRSFGPDGFGDLACLTIRSEAGAKYSFCVSGLHSFAPV